jgi:Zn-dependent protease
MNAVTRNWSLCIGRWREAEVRLHVLFPLTALGAFYATRNVHRFDERFVTWALMVLLVSVALHELARVIAALRVGGQASTLVIGPIGGFSKVHLPADPPAHLLTAMVGPLVSFALLVIAACGLALSGHRDVLKFFMSPNDLEVVFPHLGAQFISLTMLAQLFVCINGCLLLVSLLPMDPCAGAEILRGILWPVVGRTSAVTATSHVALGMSAFFAVSAFLVAQTEGPSVVMPTWCPLAVISLLLLFGGRSSLIANNYDIGLAIDELDSDDESWIAAAEWEPEDREAVLVEHLQDKQQEALDRKRREQEANEDARVDDILARLHETGFEHLSEEDRAFLKRASRRYQQRRGGPKKDR